MNTILVVDDEADMRFAIKEALGRKGYSIDLAEDGKEALKKINESSYGMVISDMKMPGLGGMDVLKGVKLAAPHVPVLLITAFGTIQKAVEAVKEGAVDFILKPFTLEALLSSPIAPTTSRSPDTDTDVPNRSVSPVFEAFR